jgi:hypothetical protein
LKTQPLTAKPLQTKTSITSGIQIVIKKFQLVLVQELEQVQQLDESQYKKNQKQNRSVATKNILSKKKLTVPATRILFIHLLRVGKIPSACAWQKVSPISTSPISTSLMRPTTHT